MIVENKQILLDNINNIHTTKMGFDRIKKNLELKNINIVEYCENKILDKNCNTSKSRKNFCCIVDNIIITINYNSYNIITAHKLK